jgi:diguanylate cyclase (GGDEF)-like protein/PAS domain S-box-containing protein
MLLVAALAIFQSAAIYWSIGAQRNAAHIIDISGAQRMRTQALAYLALSVRSGNAEPGAAAQIEGLIADMLSVRVQIERNPEYLSGPVDSHGTTALGRLAAQYVKAVRAVEHDPTDAAAFDRVRTLRPQLFDAYDAAVKKRVGVADAKIQSTLAVLLISLALQIASIAGVWYAIVKPAERRTQRLFDKVHKSRQEIESTFAENPDAISVYDSAGLLVRLNTSRARLLGELPHEMIGRHYTEFVAPQHRAAAQLAFERAITGETVAIETQLFADGKTVDVATTMFPRFVDNEYAGVIVVAKDLRKLRAAEALNIEQSRRLADLYEIASAHDRSTEELITSAIGLVAARLGYDYGAVSEIDGDMTTVIATFGNPYGLTVGETRPLRTSLAQLAIAEPEIYQARDFHATPWATQSLRDLNWRSVAGMKIFIGGVLYGTCGFAARTVFENDLSESDIGFMRLACALIGTIIERGRQLRHLDSLAHTDSLTGLPNRADFAARLAECVASETPFALHYVDLDKFKAVNDTYGHAAGDAVLCVAAKRLARCVRDGDLVARLGGDEFAIIQMGPIDTERAAELAQRVVDAFKNPIDLGESTHDVGASVGVALYPDHGRSAHELAIAADAALYASKRGGRNRMAVASTEMLETA